MTKLILTDIDETVLVFSRAFEKWLVEQKGFTLKGGMRDLYDITRMVDVDDATGTALIEEFHRGALDQFGDLQPEPDALEVLPRLYKQGYLFVAITACVNTPEIRKARLANLHRAFGFYWLDCHCVGLHQDKDKVLETYPPSVWVEDNFRHAVAGSEIGHHSYLLTRGYNYGRAHPDVTRVESWRDIEAALAGETKLAS